MNNKYPWKQAIITGLIVSIFAIGSFTVADSLNKHFAWGVNTTTIRGLTGLLALIILGIGIYTGMQSVKRSNSGKLTFGKALLAGFIIALTTGIITVLVGFIYCDYINPGYAAYMLSESKKAMIADGKSSAEIAASMPGLRQQWTTGGQMLQALVGQTVCGTVIALIMALFVKSKK
ncbi:Protein of unknown function [Mucilaginibacter lappiensis]|uniref:F0F1-type ATP synthase membrane subunit c/vacuolar-type H+-ATPase subunit K n=1 Tax=Mucilaginibacter lappiensis TaxID=354630 RepID=A0ABR6PGA2_9SPHI|nr:DUF4199 domain-containing protein [Mucilaginibacter lappiensis]MBB6108772.1 F0F1-type ATP synthase membrane subunit c/vacuolar-type H+-ATPase subunit K [Mucilaginibacter lappiensis]SIQ61626.1 Protein of unknown function [Mucilaginibacter lappiensis]